MSRRLLQIAKCGGEIPRERVASKGRVKVKIWEHGELKMHKGLPGNRPCTEPMSAEKEHRITKILEKELHRADRGRKPLRKCPKYGTISYAV